MPLPTRNDVHVDRPLSMFSLSHLQRPDNYVATQVFPIVPVQHQSDQYYERNRGDQLRDTAQRRAPGAPAVVTGVRVASASYACEMYSEADVLPDEIRANADPALRSGQDLGKVAELTQKMRTKMERVWADSFFKAEVWATDSTALSGTALWDSTAADPVGNIYAAINGVREATGVLPNCAVCSYPVFWALQNHDDIIDRWKHTHMPGQPTREFISSIFSPALSMGIKIGMGVYNSAAEEAAATVTDILGKHMLIAYANPMPSVDCETAGSSFFWTGWRDSGQMMNVRQWYDIDRQSQKFQIDAAFDFKIVDNKLGYFMQTLVS